MQDAFGGIHETRQPIQNKSSQPTGMFSGMTVKQPPSKTQPPQVTTDMFADFSMAGGAKKPDIAPPLLVQQPKFKRPNIANIQQGFGGSQNSAPQNSSGLMDIGLMDLGQKSTPTTTLKYSAFDSINLNNTPPPNTNIGGLMDLGAGGMGGGLMGLGGGTTNNAGNGADPFSGLTNLAPSDNISSMNFSLGGGMNANPQSKNEIMDLTGFQLKTTPKPPSNNSGEDTFDLL